MILNYLEKEELAITLIGMKKELSSNQDPLQKELVSFKLLMAFLITLTWKVI